MKKKTKKILIYNLKFLGLYIGLIMIWRGVWNILDYYFFPEFFNVSNFGTIFLGLLIILLNDYDLDEI